MTRIFSRQATPRLTVTRCGVPVRPVAGLRRRGKPLARPLAAAGFVASDDPRWAPIDQEIARGHPIDATRMTRQVWGLPLEEAKALVQSRPKV